MSVLSRVLTPLCSAAVLTFSLSVHAAEPLRYVALVDGGKKAGEQVVTVGDDGVTRVTFVFKDNGRGPELKEQYTLNPDGTYRDYQVTGTATFGAKIDERFRVDDGKATWKSTSDQGSQKFEEGALYAPLAGTPQTATVTIAAMAKRPGMRLPLIPSGSLSQRTVDEVELTNAKGDKRKVALLAMTGVGFTPQFAWATTGKEPRLFAFIFPGYLQLMEEGWEKSGDLLEARQKTAEGQALVELQKRLAHPLKGSTLIRNARVFDSEKGKLQKASDVLIRDGKIVSIATTGGDTIASDHVIDAGGRTLLPGLFDMHAHASRWEGGLHLAAGVTSVRDMGNDNKTLQQIIAEERAGSLLSPRIVPAGFIEGESEQSARNGFVISTLPEAKKAVDWYAEHKYPQIKIYNSFPKEILKDTVAYAHGKGLRVSGHIPVFLRAQDAIDDGYDEIQHINQLMLNFLVKPDTDTRTLERFYLPAKEVADLDFNSKPVKDFIATLARKQVVIDPTLATFEFLHARNGEMSPLIAGIEDHMPPDVQRARLAAEMDIPDDATAARYTKSFNKMVEFVGIAYRAGVPLVAGTDEVAGFTLQHELALYVKAGLTPAQALQVATWNGAKYSKVLDTLGSITPGKKADLILVDGDPTQNIADIRKVTTVIKGDVVYYPSEIHTELGIKPFAEAARVVGK